MRCLVAFSEIKEGQEFLAHGVRCRRVPRGPSSNAVEVASGRPVFVWWDTEVERILVQLSLPGVDEGGVK